MKIILTLLFVMSFILTLPVIVHAAGSIVQYAGNYNKIEYMGKYYDHDEGVVCYTYKTGISCVKDN